MADEDHTRAVAEYIHALELDAVPPDVIRKIKFHILDTVGCGLFGSTLPWSRTIHRTWAESGGPPMATVWGEGTRLPAAAAALINASFTHAFEHDDTEVKDFWAHPTGATLAAALAVGDRSGGSGRRLLEAVIVGVDVWLRVMGAINIKELGPPRGLHPYALGMFGPAAAASKMAGCSVDEIESALGIAGTEGGASEIVKHTGSNVKRLYAGRVARAGVEAVQLTENGLAGPREIFEGDYGGVFVKHWGPDNDQMYDLGWLTAGLGEDYGRSIERLEFKLYPAHTHTHVAIDLALELREAHDIDPAAIDEIVITTRTRNVNWLNHPAPDDIMLAQQSVPFTVAAAFADGEFTVEQVRPERLADPTVLAIADRIELVANAEYDALLADHIDRAHMAVTTTDGATYEATADDRTGSSAKPLSAATLREKFERTAGTRLAPARLDELHGTIMDLERVRDCTQLAALTVP